MANFYIVGGFVRDAVMGMASKDLDYSVEAESFEEMKAAILSRGEAIFQERPQFFTIRATDRIFGSADYVWCRREGPYTDGRHPDFVVPGSLMDDLARRDFTMNAMAIGEGSKNIIDPYNGLQDIQEGVIRSVGNAKEKLLEDALRVMRAIRFAVTKRMRIDTPIYDALWDMDVLTALSKVSSDRVREELMKMMRDDWLRSMNLLVHQFPRVCSTISMYFPDIWFKPTQEQR